MGISGRPVITEYLPAASMIRQPDAVRVQSAILPSNIRLEVLRIGSELWRVAP